MDDISIIDRFFNVFSSYIDSGFGLLSGEVAWLASALIVIDITLAGLFWALDENRNILSSLVKKILYVGFFALIINNFQFLSNTIFNSFAGLGLKATGSAVTAEELLQPGRIAATGFDAAFPIITQIGDLLGPVAFFENFILIIVLLFAWILVVLAFFILAIQLFITILEFKITTLAGFVLIPFALWNKTSFLAERVLGGVVSSGIKVMALAIIIGIGSLIFGDFAAAMSGTEATLKKCHVPCIGCIVFTWSQYLCPRHCGWACEWRTATGCWSSGWYCCGRCRRCGRWRRGRSHGRKRGGKSRHRCCQCRSESRWPSKRSL